MPTTYTPQFDLAAAFPHLERRVATRLHPRRGRVDLFASKVGGVIPWPKAVPWPRCAADGSALVPALQLRRADVANLPYPGDSDVFQLLWCPRDHAESGHAPLPEVFWWHARDLDGDSSARPDPLDANDDYLPRE